MKDKELLGLGAAAAIVGAVLGTIVNMAHPRILDDADAVASTTETLLTEVAGNDYWIAIHLGIAVAVLLLAVAFVAIGSTITGGRGQALARLGRYSAAIGATLGVALAGMDGVGVKTIATSWDAASASTQTAELVSAASVTAASEGLFMMFAFVLFGVTPLVMGLAIIYGEGWRNVMGWIAAIIGVAGIIAAFTGSYEGAASEYFDSMFTTSSLLLTLWVLIAGFTLWGMSKDAQPAT